jgi:5-methylcytosine-specific restriction endonuclease McrA
MVLICEQCNLKKGAKTLREFIRENNFDTGSIESALELLGKRF